jgi:hypothetical protein
MQSELQRKLSLVSAALSSNESASELAVTLVLRLSELRPDQSRFLSYSSVASLASVSADDPRVMLAVSTLTNTTANVLTMMMVIYTDHDREYILSPSEFTAAKRDGYLVDPDSGRVRPDVLDNTFPYFRTTEAFAACQVSA